MEGIVSVEEVKRTQKKWKRDFFKDIVKNFPGAVIEGGLAALTVGGVLSCVAGGISFAAGAKELGAYLFVGGGTGFLTGGISLAIYGISLEAVGGDDAITKLGKSIKLYQKLRKIHFTEFYREDFSCMGKLESDIPLKERITEYLMTKKEDPYIINKTLEDMSKSELL